MAKLNQIIAVEKGVKSQTLSKITELYQQLQKPALLSGISRTYQPKDEEGERYPPEATKVQVRVEDVIEEMTIAWKRLFDVVATKDWANTEATADVVVDSTILMLGVPATYLLFLEKQLVDIHTFVEKLPVLDPSEDWQYDGTSDTYKTELVQTAKSKKVPRNHVKAEATDRHPAQVETYMEDVMVGYWNTTKFSGALPASEVRRYLERVETLQRAVKYAREEANGTEVRDVIVGEHIFHYLFE